MSHINPHGYSHNKGVNDDTIAALKSVDAMIDRQYHPTEAVDVFSGAGGLHGISTYTDKGVLPIEEKWRYSHILGTTPQIHTTISDEDVEKMKHKAYVATLRDFDRWVVDYMHGLPLDAPQKKDWLKSVYPEFFERQVEAMKLLEDARERYDKLNVEGAYTIPDMYFMFMFEQEKLLANSTQDFEVAAGLYATDNTLAEVDEVADLAFERGIWNTRKRFMNMFTAFNLQSDSGDRPYRLGPQPALHEGHRTRGGRSRHPQRPVAMREPMEGVELKRGEDLVDEGKPPGRALSR